jgi:hypothetical protein
MDFQKKKKKKVRKMLKAGSFFFFFYTLHLKLSAMLPKSMAFSQKLT